MTFTAVGMWMVAYAVSAVVAGAAALLIGLGFVVAFPAWLALISHVTPADRRGEVLGSIGAAQGLGMLTGASIGGLLYGSRGLRLPQLGIESLNMPFVTSALCLSVSTVLCFALVYSGTRYKLAAPDAAAESLSGLASRDGVP